MNDVFINSKWKYSSIYNLCNHFTTTRSNQSEVEQEAEHETVEHVDTEVS